MNYYEYEGTLKELLEEDYIKKAATIEFSKYIINIINGEKQIEPVELSDLKQDLDSPELEKYFDYLVDSYYPGIDDDLNITIYITLSKFTEIKHDKLEPYKSFYTDVYNHAIIVNGNIQCFKDKEDETPSARFNVESVVATKLYLSDEKYPVLRISWFWDDDRDMNFLEISPKNPEVKDVFTLMELQDNITRNHTLNHSHKYLGRILK